MVTQDDITQSGSIIVTRSIFNMKAVHWAGSQYENLKDEIQLFLSQMTETPSVVEVLDLFSSFQTILSLQLNDIEFNKLTETQKLCISMIYASDLYIEFLSSTIGFKTTWQGWNRVTHLKEDPQDIEEVKAQISAYLSLSSTFRYERTTPPLKKVFSYLTQTKNSYCFILEWFFSYLEHITQISFDYKTFNNLFESIVEENYERFSDIVYSWNNVVVHELSASIEILFPLLHFIESNLDDSDKILHNIRKEIFSGVSPETEINISPITTLFLFIISYLYQNNLHAYLTYYQQDHSLTPFRAFISKDFMDIYNDWIEKEIEALSYFFRNNSLFCSPMGTLGEIDNTNDNVKNFEDREIGQEKQQGTSASSHNEGQPDETQKQPKDPKPEPIEKPFIKVPCGHRMLDKLINGLINGHNDDTLGGFIPLVSSKTGEDKESIKKKLICLFTGEGINDESIKWPYDLKWNDKANSLKLLVYLLHYEGIIIDPLDEKEGAIDKEDVEGINQKIRTEFRGKNVWAIVGPALGYGKNTLRNKIKIPKQSNLSLMKKLAQFWFECKKLDD